MYEELIERLRNKADTLSYFNNAEDYRAAADAIEELLESSLNFEELWQQSEEMRRKLQDKLDKINSLKHDGYYTGTYIKALMGVSNGDDK